MQVDWSVELGAGDPVLDFPWSSPDGRQRYFDLKRQPELLSAITEATREPALGEFLAAVNARAGSFRTAKCDAWASREITPEEEIFGASCKFACYVDLLLEEEESRFAFDQHEELARRLAALLNKVPEIAAAAEFIVRRCYYQARDGFYVTCYCFGYGDDEAQAHKQWTIALKLVENAVLQVSAEGL